MTIDEALLYDAEWWVTPLDKIQCQHEYDFSELWLGYGHTEGYFSDKRAERLSWFCLLVREAIKC